MAADEATAALANLSNKKKGKGKQLSLQEFLGDEPMVMATTKPISWADEMENQALTNDELDFSLNKVSLNKTKADLPMAPRSARELDMSHELDFSLNKVSVNKTRAGLPTAPRSARDRELDMSRVPCIPPFTAFLGNLPYDISSEEIEKFFRDLKLQCANVRLPRDQGRPKGFGYAEFDTKQSLIEALTLTQPVLRGRQIRIDLAEASLERGGHGEGPERGPRGSQRGGHHPQEDRTWGDWRRRFNSAGDGGGDGPPLEPNFSPSYHNQPGAFNKGMRGGGYAGRSTVVNHSSGDSFTMMSHDPLLLSMDPFPDFHRPQFNRHNSEGPLPDWSHTVNFHMGKTHNNSDPFDLFPGGSDPYNRGNELYNRGNNFHGDSARGRDKNGSVLGEGAGGRMEPDSGRRGGRGGAKSGRGSFEEAGVRRGRGGGRGRRLDGRLSESQIGYNPGSPEFNSGPRFAGLPRSLSIDEAQQKSSVNDLEGRKERRKLVLASRTKLSSSDNEPGNLEGRKERRRLVLAPRTKLSSSDNEPGSQSEKSSSIFGGAKPVDTATKEREIEERLLRQKQELEKENQQESQQTEGERKGEKRSNSETFTRSISQTSESSVGSGVTRARKVSSSSVEGTSGAGNSTATSVQPRRERKSSSSSAKVMPPPSISRIHRDSTRSDNDEVFYEDGTPPKTLPLPIKEESRGSANSSTGGVARGNEAANRKVPENVWDKRKSEK